MIQILKSGSHPIPPQGSDVGYDLVAVSEPNIVGETDDSGKYRSIQYIEYDTGVKLRGEGEMDTMEFCGKTINYRHLDHYSLVYPRSSISKYNLVLANSIGVIDPGFVDSIKVRFKYIYQPNDLHLSIVGRFSVSVDLTKIYQKGDKIAQLIFAQKFTPQIEFVDELKKTQRGTGGFGSTGT